MKEYWSLNPSQAFPFFRQVFTRDRFLDILYSLHYPALEGSVHKLKKVLYPVQHLSQQYQWFYLPEREICVDESIIGFLEKQKTCYSWVCSSVQQVHVGGVDLSDMRIYCFQDERRTIRWNIKVFFLLFGRTLLNSFIVYQRNTSSPMVYQTFLERVVDGLVGTFRMPCTQRNRVLPVQVTLQPPPPPDR